MTDETMPKIVCESDETEGLGGGGERVEFAISSASAELRINRDKEPWFRRLLLQKVFLDGAVDLREAIDGLAETIGASPVTTRRYLLKMTSRSGPLIVEETPSGGRLIKIRPEYWEKLAVLESKEKKA